MIFHQITLLTTQTKSLQNLKEFYKVIFYNPKNTVFLENALFTSTTVDNCHIIQNSAGMD